jgi:2-hydroxy-6-oxonona-2,4-dienedioate hydrolase
MNNQSKESIMNNPTITRINLNDPVSKAALDAEQRFFAHYGLEYQMHMLEMEYPKVRLRVLEVGEGPPVLMVPGGAGDAFKLAPLMAQLTGWRMIAVNRPGAGLSDGVDHRQLDLRQLAVDTVRTVADAFDLDRAPIICNSMGGLWSFWYTLAYTERVSAMVQMGCPALILNTSAPFFMRLLGVPGINRFIAPQIQPKSIDTTLDGLRFQGSSQADIDNMPRVTAEVAYHMYQLPTYLDTWKTLVGAVATISGANPRYQLRAEEIAGIDQPIQFIWGDNDVFGDLNVAHQVARIIPNAQLHEVQSGHLPFMDQPETVGAMIREFLGQHEPMMADEQMAVTVPA